jgi:hypothetical protein
VFGGDFGTASNYFGRNLRLTFTPPLVAVFRPSSLIGAGPLGQSIPAMWINQSNGEALKLIAHSVWQSARPHKSLREKKMAMVVY